MNGITPRPSQRARPLSTTSAVVSLLAVLLVLLLVLAPRAEAFIYWTAGSPATKIGRASLDGSGVDPNFFAATGLSGSASAVAVDAEHIYWTHELDGTGGPTGSAIGRAKLDGTRLNPGFVSAAGPTGTFPGALAVDAGHLYWTNSIPRGGGGTIGRANLDGSGVDLAFIANISSLGYVAVDAGHVYWTNFDTDTIGRANLDGSGVDQSFITGIDMPSGIAVNADHVYWTELVCSAFMSPCAPAIGRANLDGTNVDHRFITGGADFQFGRWSDVAVDANFVYWTQGFQGGNADTIMRANLDGTGASTFIPEGELGDSDEVSLRGLAVDALTDTGIAGKASAAKTQKQAGKKIVVKAKAKAKEKLTAKARGKVKVDHTYKLKPKTALLATGQTATLKLKPPKSGQAKRIVGALKRGKKATAKLTVKLSDHAGNTESERLSVRLKR